MVQNPFNGIESLKSPGESLSLRRRIHSMELKVYIGFGVRGCYVVNPFNGIERGTGATRIPSGFRSSTPNPFNGIESCMDSLCIWCRVGYLRIHSMELKEGVSD
jgi:hypothetical protein